MLELPIDHRVLDRIKNGNAKGLEMYPLTPKNKEQITVCGIFYKGTGEIFNPSNEVSLNIDLSLPLSSVAINEVTEVISALVKFDEYNGTSFAIELLKEVHNAGGGSLKAGIETHNELNTVIYGSKPEDYTLELAEFKRSVRKKTSKGTFELNIVQYVTNDEGKGIMFVYIEDKG